MKAENLGDDVALQQFGIHADDAQQEGFGSWLQVLWLLSHIVSAFSLYPLVFSSAPRAAGKIAVKKCGGGRRRIRTFVGVSQQIYSLPSLAT
jgi:hypothetical protein